MHFQSMMNKTLKKKSKRTGCLGPKWCKILLLNVEVYSYKEIFKTISMKINERMSTSHKRLLIKTLKCEREQLGVEEQVICVKVSEEKSTRATDSR